MKHKIMKIWHIDSFDRSAVYLFVKNVLVFQIWFVRNKLSSGGQLPQQFVYKSQWETVSITCKGFLLCLNRQLNLTYLKEPIQSLIFCLQGFAPPPKNGVEQKRPGRPLNITSLVRLSSAVPNQISVTWAPEVGKVSAVKDRITIKWRTCSGFNIWLLHMVCRLSQVYVWLMTWLSLCDIGNKSSQKYRLCVLVRQE